MAESATGAGTRAEPAIGARAVAGAPRARRRPPVAALALWAALALPAAAPHAAAAAEAAAVPAAAPQVEAAAAATPDPGAAAGIGGGTGAASAGASEGERYASLRSNRIHVRRGPGQEYRKDWTFLRAGLPVRVLESYGDWRRIVDSDNAGGWVYHALLTQRRTALVIAPEAVLRARADAAARPVARAEQGVVARLLACEPGWCRIEADGHRGWVATAEIWGVAPGERF